VLILQATVCLGVDKFLPQTPLRLELINSYRTPHCGSSIGPWVHLYTARPSCGFSAVLRYLPTNPPQEEEPTSNRGSLERPHFYCFFCSSIYLSSCSTWGYCPPSMAIALHLLSKRPTARLLITLNDPKRNNFKK